MLVTFRTLLSQKTESGTPGLQGRWSLRGVFASIEDAPGPFRGSTLPKWWSRWIISPRSVYILRVWRRAWRRLWSSRFAIAQRPDACTRPPVVELIRWWVVMTPRTRIYSRFYFDGHRQCLFANWWVIAPRPCRWQRLLVREASLPSFLRMPRSFTPWTGRFRRLLVGVCFLFRRISVAPSPWLVSFALGRIKSTRHTDASKWGQAFSIWTSRRRRHLPVSRNSRVLLQRIPLISRSFEIFKCWFCFRSCLQSGNNRTTSRTCRMAMKVINSSERRLLLWFSRLWCPCRLDGFFFGWYNVAKVLQNRMSDIIRRLCLSLLRKVMVE